MSRVGSPRPERRQVGLLAVWWVWLVSVGIAPASAVELSVHETLRVYEIHADKARQLHAALNEERPAIGPGLGSRSHALTEIILDSRLTVIERDGGCHWEGPDIVLGMTTWLPHWVNQATASPYLQRQWKRLRKGLEEHEAGHRELARAAAGEWLEQIRAIDRSEFSGKPCRAIQRRLAGLRTRALLRLQVRQDRYDARTEFGGLQGAVLDFGDSVLCVGPKRPLSRTCSALVSPSCECSR